MKDYTATCLLDDALRVAKSGAIKNKNVKFLLNAILVVTMNCRNENGQRLADEIYNILDEIDFYGKSKGAEPYNN